MQKNQQIECTSCGKVISLENPQASRKVVWRQGRPYCEKKCILKENRIFCLCGDSTENKDGVCDTCKLIDSYNTKRKKELK